LLLVIDNGTRRDGNRQLPSGPVPDVEPGDLIDASEVAPIIGVSSSKAVAVYRARYPDFPAPFVTKASGKCVLWLRADIEKWAKARRG
jgi:hypothetical protein